ncbi:MAG TPA: MFS transporter [Candidatus Nanoarchaeia archaeon]|nr:MFS transporter [Candidatus Nanoarchaeia archaeon]
MPKKESKKTVRAFAFASFFNDMGSDIIAPIWPLFVTTFAGANMQVLGLIDGIGEAIVSISQAVSGYLSDRLKKRKFFIWLGYLFGGLSRIGYALSTAWQHLIPFRILDRGGKIRNSPRDAIVADLSGKEKGKNFGFIRAFDNLGAVCGILISIFFLGFFGYKKMFLLAAIPSVIAVAIVLIFVKERKNHIKLHKGMSLKNLSPRLKVFLVSSSLFSLSAFSYSFLLIYAKNFGFKIATIPVLYLVFTAVASATSIYFGKLSDKVGRKNILYLAYFFWIISCGAFIILQSYFTIVLAFVFYGLHKGAFEPVQRAFVSELSVPRFRASTLGGFQMVIGLIALPASFLAGILWSKVSVSAPFYFAIGLTLMSMVILIFVKEK